jgi:coenzyme F420-0:L-glutamate ligase/coenzyme F420-1:gamma-L-glutamate ligase
MADEVPSMATDRLQITGLPGFPEIKAGHDLAQIVSDSCRAAQFEIRDGDVLVVAQKIVSKSEGRVVALGSINPSDQAVEFAAKFDKDPRVVEVVMRESKRIVRMERGLIISETPHGFVCANAGVDTSNVAEGTVCLLPEDPDASALRLKSALEQRFRVRMAVIVSDTFGRPWREGLVNVAIGIAGLAPLIDYRGQRDWHGHQLKSTVIAIADEAASAAELVMGKSDGIPAAVIRGLDYDARDGSSGELIRAPGLDLFR